LNSNNLKPKFALRRPK